MTTIRRFASRVGSGPRPLLAAAAVSAAILGGGLAVATVEDAAAQACRCPETTPQEGGGAGTPPPRPSDEREQAGGGGDGDGGAALLPALVAGGAGALALAGTLLYFLVLSPRRKRAVLLEALAIVERDQEEAFPEAAELLDRALTVGLRSRDVDDARFALAYVYARTGRLEEASAALAPLVDSGRPGREVLYLDLWLKVRREQYEEATRLFDEFGSELGDMLQSRLIASIAYLNVGRTALRRREADRALQSFERVRELGVLAEKVPQDVADHQVVLGIEALFDQHFEQARERFAAARAAAEHEGRGTLYPDLGLLLCEWRETPQPGADFDRRLGELAEAGAAEAGVGGAAEDGPTQLGRLFRDVLVWHAVSGLFTAFHLRAGEGRPPDGWGDVHDRLQRARDVDPDMADPDLIGGLVDYYFATSEDERARAVAMLEQAREKGANVPEVNLLVEREHALAKAAEESVDHFLAVVRNYLGERTVPVEVRRELQERLSGMARFKRLADVDVERGEGEIAPSIDDLHGRAELIHRRVERILTPRLTTAAPEEAEEVGRMLGELAGATHTLSSTAQQLQRSERDLMIATGEFLLREEEEESVDDGGSRGGREERGEGEERWPSAPSTG